MTPDDGRRQPSTREVVHLCCYLDSNVFGGMEMSFSTLLGHLDPRYRVSLLGTSEPVLRLVARARPGTEARVVPRVQGKLDVRAIISHVNALRSLRPDLLLVGLPALYSGQYGMLAGLATRTPTVAVVHSLTPAAGRVQALLFRWVARRVARMGGVSRWMSEGVEHEVGLPPGTVVLLYNGVPPSLEDQQLPAHPAEELKRRPVIGAVGRLSPEKGFDTLIRALRHVPDCDLVILGEGPERPALESLTARLDLKQRVRFAGWVEPPWTSSWQFDVVAIPSETESFGLVAIEAMRAGIPVVATQVGGLTEVVDDDATGVLVPPGDLDAFVEGLRRLLDDPALRRRMSATASSRMAGRFTPGTMASAYEDLFDDVLARSRLRAAQRHPPAR